MNNTDHLIEQRKLNRYKKRNSKARIQSVLEKRALGERTSSGLAREYGISPSTISVWAQKYGFPKLQQGRRPAIKPSKRHMQILRATNSLTYEQVGAIHGVSKQRVANVVRRWRSFIGKSARQSTKLRDAAQI